MNVDDTQKKVFQIVEKMNHCTKDRQSRRLEIIRLKKEVEHLECEQRQAENTWEELQKSLHELQDQCNHNDGTRSCLIQTSYDDPHRTGFEIVERCCTACGRVMKNRRSQNVGGALHTRWPEGFAGKEVRRLDYEPFMRVKKGFVLKGF
jgi:hypothetical protein